jgi:hypothetical protein
LQLFLTLEHLKAIVGLFIGLILILLFQVIGRPEGRKKGEEQQVGGAVKTHTICTNDLHGPFFPESFRELNSVQKEHA